MQSLNVAWPELKSFITTRSLSAQWVIANSSYYIYAFDGPFALSCQIDMAQGDDTPTNDQTDFETNFKNNGNQAPTPQVITQFEKTDKTLRLACLSGTITDSSNGTIVATLKVPGTPGSGEGRYLSSGSAWFSPQSDDDRVTVFVTDEDNLLGYGAGTVVGTYTDTDVPAENSGWYIPAKMGFIKVEAFAGYGFVPAGMYIKVVGHKGGSAPFTGTMYINLEWGKKG